MSIDPEVPQSRAPAFNSRGEPVKGGPWSPAPGGFLSWAQFDLLDMLIGEGSMSCDEINDRVVPRINFESTQRRLRTWRKQGLISSVAQDENMAWDSWGGLGRKRKDVKRGILIYSITDLGREKFAATLAAIDAKQEREDEREKRREARRRKQAEACGGKAEEWDAQEQAFRGAG